MTTVEQTHLLHLNPKVHCASEEAAEKFDRMHSFLRTAFNPMASVAVQNGSLVELIRLCHEELGDWDPIQASYPGQEMASPGTIDPTGLGVRGDKNVNA